MNNTTPPPGPHDRIRDLRSERGWTQATLAAAANLTERTVQRAEAGVAISSETLLAIAGALNVEVADLAYKAVQLFPLDVDTLKVLVGQVKAIDVSVFPGAQLSPELVDVEEKLLAPETMHEALEHLDRADLRAVGRDFERDGERYLGVMIVPKGGGFSAQYRVSPETKE